MKVLLTLAGLALGALALRRAVSPGTTDPWHQATTPEPASAAAAEHPGT
ncbi:MAG: hypothetical protein ABI181_07600 [Mycobacteriaceae bacterium]